MAQYASDLSSYGTGCLRTIKLGTDGMGAATNKVAIPTITIDASLCSSVYQNGLTEVRPDNKAVNYIIKL